MYTTHSPIKTNGTLSPSNPTAIVRMLVPPNDLPIAPFSVGVTPGSSASVSVQFSLDFGADNPANMSSVNWFPWSLGTVSVANSSTFNSGCVALQFTLVSGTSAAFAVNG